ncbi:MAG: Mrp/NBP35 family ATP-binding protein [Synergistaceae bacterium]|nr:Mrp/NBP35 family ATP-binding protein [Synergistaceae bacterium]
MSECNHNCEGCGANCSQRKSAPDKFQANPNSVIKNVIGIVSGKGGVGKSLVTGLLASSMRDKGLRVSILDADITGPSIPKIFGLHEQVLSDGHNILPAITKKGIKVISMNLCLPNENDPVVWRGPVLAGVLQQFWEEVDWGFTDYMFVDMPPGTGDVPLTVFQSLPLKGIIIVTTPQELVSMIVNKALKMAQLMNVPVLGLVENMAYFECPDCGKKHYLFGEGKLEAIASEAGIALTAELPIVPGLAGLCDKGEIESFDAGKYFEDIINNL